MRTFFGITLVVLLAVALVGCPSNGKTKTDDKTKTGASEEKPSIIGTWEAKTPDGDVVGFTFKKDETVELSENGEKEEGTMVYKLDDGKDPMHLDIIVKEGDMEMPLMKGIAKWEGGKLKFFASKKDGAPRPEKFDEKETLLFEKK